MKPRFLDKIKHRLVFFGSLFFVTFIYSYIANAQSCRDLGYSGTHTDTIERLGGFETQSYMDIVRIQVPHSSLGVLYPTPVSTTSFNYINNTNLYPVPARRTLSGGVLGQYGSSDFVLTSGGTFGGASGDEFYAFKVSFSPITIGNAFGVAEIEYFGISVHATSPYEEYNFVQKICYEFSALGSPSNDPDLILSPISIPKSKNDPNSQVQIIPVGVPIQVNVPVSINFVGALPSAVLNSSVPVTLQVGSYASTQNVSIASLVANQNQALVTFLVTFQSSEAGLKTLVASVNATRAVSESNFTNNEAQLNVRVGDGYKLNVSVLDLTNKNLCKTLVGPDIGSTYCQSGEIRDGSVLDVPFGAHLDFELRDKADNIIPATYQLVGAITMPDDPDSVTSEKIELEDYSLYRDRLAVLFNQDNLKNSQSFITVHLGKQKLRITPLGPGMAPVTVILNSFGVKIGNGNNFYDKLIRGRAHKIGLPPQYVKGQILQEAGGSFDAGAYRYEPKTNDIELIQPKLVTIGGILKFDTKDYKYNVENIRYNKYLFRHTDRLLSKEDSLNSIQKEQINKRSLYYVKFNNEPKKITLDYETTIKPNEYTPLYVSDIASANKTENWKMSQSEINSSKNKVAQTIISASYGLWQILYTTAVEEAGFGEPGGAGVIYTAGKDPRLLFDPKINLLHGGFYLNKCIKEVNKLQVAKVNPHKSIDEFNTHVKLGYAGYNAGLGHENIAYPDFNEDYRDKTFAKVKKFTILLSKEIF